ncbi:MAG: squalene--hopene cyclase [Chloroflexota bacterium]|nr:squalene--hopene cyclase [Chloroflexota bacterium]
MDAAAREQERVSLRVEEALGKVQDYFLRTQHPDGYWWGELESNPTMEAEHIMLLAFLGSREPERVRLVANDILRRQREDGSWGMYYGAPGDLSTSVECYFALKLAGHAPNEAVMRRAREFILSKGGVPKARVFTKIWLALFGQWPWEGTPMMPPEMILLPPWAPFNIYRWSSWARGTIVPLTVVLAKRPVKRLSIAQSIGELLPRGEKIRYWLPCRAENALSIETLLWLGDKALHVYERLPWKPFRGMALRRIKRWLIDRQEADGSWGGIQPPWVYSLIALNVLGAGLGDPVVRKGLAGFRGEWSLRSEDGESMRVQACLSPVWDTCLAVLGLLDSGMAPNHPAIQRACKWMMEREIRRKGDWAVGVKDVEPSGWAFEFANETYPDIDDSSIIVMALHAARFDSEREEQARREVVGRALRWIEAMQSANGGWAAFDKDNDSPLLARLPFSDFGEVLDPPTVDVTAHILEMYGRLGIKNTKPVRRGLAYVKRHQEPDGSWFGRWGVNYVYGAGAVLPALEALGEDMSKPYVRRAVDWLLDHQNPDGGWGESCASYVDPSLKGRGESTASQTAWALIGLIAAGRTHTGVARHGVEYLANTQREDGTWDEPHFTACGFPGYGVGNRPDELRPVGDPNWQGQELGAAFMINYHLYRNYFPLWALGRYARALKEDARNGGFQLWTRRNGHKPARASSNGQAPSEAAHEQA